MHRSRSSSRRVRGRGVCISSEQDGSSAVTQQGPLSIAAAQAAADSRLSTKANESCDSLTLSGGSSSLSLAVAAAMSRHTKLCGELTAAIACAAIARTNFVASMREVKTEEAAQRAALGTGSVGASATGFSRRATETARAETALRLERLNRVHTSEGMSLEASRLCILSEPIQGKLDELRSHARVLLQELRTAEAMEPAENILSEGHSFTEACEAVAEAQCQTALETRLLRAQIVEVEAENNSMRNIASEHSVESERVARVVQGLRGHLVKLTDECDADEADFLYSSPRGSARQPSVEAAHEAFRLRSESECAECEIQALQLQLLGAFHTVDLSSAGDDRAKFGVRRTTRSARVAALRAMSFKSWSHSGLDEDVYSTSDGYDVTGTANVPFSNDFEALASVTHMDLLSSPLGTSTPSISLTPSSWYSVPAQGALNLIASTRRLRVEAEAMRSVLVLPHGSTAACVAASARKQLRVEAGSLRGVLELPLDLSDSLRASRTLLRGNLQEQLVASRNLISELRLACGKASKQLSSEQRILESLEEKLRLSQSDILPKPSARRLCGAAAVTVQPKVP